MASSGSIWNFNLLRSEAGTPTFPKIAKVAKFTEAQKKEKRELQAVEQGPTQRQEEAVYKVPDEAKFIPINTSAYLASRSSRDTEETSAGLLPTKATKPSTFDKKVTTGSLRKGTRKGSALESGTTNKRQPVGGKVVWIKCEDESPFMTPDQSDQAQIQKMDPTDDTIRISSEFDVERPKQNKNRKRRRLLTKRGAHTGEQVWQSSPVAEQSVLEVSSVRRDRDIDDGEREAQALMSMAENNLASRMARLRSQGRSRLFPSEVWGGLWTYDETPRSRRKKGSKKQTSKKCARGRSRESSQNSSKEGSKERGSEGSKESSRENSKSDNRTGSKESTIVEEDIKIDIVKSEPIEEEIEDDYDTEAWYKTMDAPNIGCPLWCTKLLFRAWNERSSFQRLNIEGRYEAMTDGEDGIRFVSEFAGTFSAPSCNFPPPEGRLARKRVLENFLNGFSGQQTNTQAVDANSTPHGNLSRIIEEEEQQELDFDAYLSSSSSSSSDETENDQGNMFISLTMSWEEAIRYAEWGEGRCKEKRKAKRIVKSSGAKSYITVVQSDVAANTSDWKMLRALDEVSEYSVELRDWGDPSSKGGTSNEVLMLERVPQEAILKTYSLDDVRHWKAMDVLRDLEIGEDDIHRFCWCLE